MKVSSRLLLLASLVTVASPAMAYLDPSTGSMILSAIVGVLATVGLALKTWWYKLKALVRGRPATASATENRPVGADRHGPGGPRT